MVRSATAQDRDYPPSGPALAGLAQRRSPATKTAPARAGFAALAQKFFVFVP